MYLGLGLRIGGVNTTDGTGGGGGAAINAPVLTQTSTAGANPFTWDTTIDATVYSGYFAQLQVDTASDFASPDQDLLQMLTPSDIAAGDMTFTGFTTPTGALYMRMRFWDGASQYSAWSNTLNDTIAPTLPASPEFQFEADDLTTLFKEIAGSTAVTTSGDTVGKWTDKSGNAIHIVAPADTAVRPLYDLTSGVHSVVGNATNSTALSGTTIPAMWQAGSWTIVLAIKANPATAAILVSEGDSASNNTIASYIRSNGTTASSAGYSFIRANDGATNLTDPTVVLKTGVFDNNYRVFIVSDDGTGLTTWLDGVKTAKITSGYNRGGGSITVNRFSMFARLRTTFDSYFTGQVQLAVGYNYAFSDAEAAQATTYAGDKQGRSL